MPAPTIGVYVSLDDGAHWQPLQRNLPTAWVRDLLVHGNDLIAATQGRAIWVLDDVAPLRQVGRRCARTAHLFTPPRPCACARTRTTTRRCRRRTDRPESADRRASSTTGSGDSASRVELEIRDASGRLRAPLRKRRRRRQAGGRALLRGGLARARTGAGGDAGMHRFVWDLR